MTKQSVYLAYYVNFMNVCGSQTSVKIYDKFLIYRYYDKKFVELTAIKLYKLATNWVIGDVNQ